MVELPDAGIPSDATASPPPAGVDHPSVPGTHAPPLPDAGLRPLDPRVVGYWRIRLAAWTGATAIAAAACGAWLADTLGAALIALAALALAGATASLLPRARYRAWGFAVRQADLVVRRGVVWRTTSIVPHARIQHVDTRQGPLERRLGLARVVVHTAGSVGGAIGIPGLALPHAESLRDQLAALGGDDGV